MRVALFGGSFDPPHRGHVALARLARERLLLDRIVVAPVAAQPLKQQMPPASFEDRVAMTRLAFADEPGTEVSLIDAPRPEGRSNYTIDTLTALRHEINPGDALYCIIGADSFLTIKSWHRSADLLTFCDFIVGARPGFDLNDIAAVLPSGITAAPLPSEHPQVRVFRIRGVTGSSRLSLLTGLAEDVSATQIRSALRGESGSANVLAPAVLEYIRTNHLYTHL